VDSLIKQNQDNQIKENYWIIKWIIYFCVLYFVLMIPTPLTYTKELYLGPLGMPLFVWGWIIDNFLVILGMFIFYAEAKRRGLIED